MPQTHPVELAWYLLLQTPLALLDRVKKNGGKEIRNVMSDWKFWIPTKKGQVTIIYMGLPM